MSRTPSTVEAVVLARRGERRMLRTAAWGALAAAVAYLLVPFLRSVVAAVLHADTPSEYPTPSEIPAQEWSGLLLLTLYGVIAAGTLTLTTAAMTVVESRGGVTTGTRLARAAGLVAAVSFLLFGAGARAMWSFIAANLAETGADQPSQVAALWAVNVAVSAPIHAAVVGMAAWCVLFAVLCGRTRVVSRAAAIVAAALTIVAAVLIVVIVLLPAQLLIGLAFVTLATGLLVSSRQHAAHDGTVASVS